MASLHRPILPSDEARDVDSRNLPEMRMPWTAEYPPYLARYIGLIVPGMALLIGFRQFERRRQRHQRQTVGQLSPSICDRVFAK